MYDSVTPSAIPASARMVAGYVNGDFAWSRADWARFPHAAQIGINVTGRLADGGTIIDVETGDATTAAIPGWVRGREAAGQMHGVYCQLSRLPEVQAVLRAVPIPTAIWVASWTPSVPHQVPGCVATQFVNRASIDYDLSAVYNDDWHPTP
jgi:hypothetical protein